MERSKIAFTSKLRPPQTRVPLDRVLQPLQQNRAHEDPIKQIPARRMLSRRSKSFSDLRANSKPIDFLLKKPGSVNKLPPIKPLLKATSTSNLCASEARKPLFKHGLKTIPEASKGALSKQPTRTTVKRPAAGGLDEAAKPKVARPAKIPPYDYKARFNFLNEKHTLLVQTFKDSKQKLIDAEKDLEDYGLLKEEHLNCQGKYDVILQAKSQAEAQCLEVVEEGKKLKNSLDSLRSSHKDLEENHERLKKENAEHLNNINNLEQIKNQRENELSDAQTTIGTLQEELQEYKTSLQSHEELRRMMHNQIQDLKGTIRVFCRVRPCKPQEHDKMLCNISCVDEATLEIRKCKESISSISGKATDLKLDFIFDKVFPPEATQVEVFEELSQLVQSALDGFHICVFAYGQTGSGKTYTMQGEESEQSSGMIPRTVHLIFNLIKNLQKIGWVYEVEASFLEIYNEIVRDLLDPNNKEHHDIRYNEGKGMTVTNLTIKKVKSAIELVQLMTTANRNRASATTNYNEHSSRSHAVTKLTLTGFNEEMRISYVGSLNLVDLAGSESAKNSSAERLTETKNINKSLSTLGTVMGALHNKENHIPYRNSKLTYLLQSCLGGNSKTLMFVNIAPFEDCYGESVNALRFAAKVKEVKIGSRRNKMYLQRECSNVTK